MRSDFPFNNTSNKVPSSELLSLFFGVAPHKKKAKEKKAYESKTVFIKLSLSYTEFGLLSRH